MYSFYGGRPGNSFVIITTFGSVEEMINAFSEGPNYTAVHYDQYVMINADNKNDPDNGKIYRRGYNYTNQFGGAEYIGTIAGPAGPAPHLMMDTIDNIKTKQTDNPDDRHDEGTYDIGNGGLVPGRYYVEGTGDYAYNDKIKWAYCSIRTADGSDAKAYIGFEFPYLVLDINTISVDPYFNGVYRDQSSAYRSETDEEPIHPFVEKWTLNIPKGIKGDSFNRIRIENENNDSQKKVFVCDEFNYDEKQNPDAVRKILGPYNVIDNITLDTNGKLTVGYTYNNNQVINENNPLKWINEVELNNDTGQFKIDYNRGDPYTANLQWVKDIQVDQESGKITLSYTGERNKEIFPGLKWINKIDLDENSKQLRVWYNNSTDPEIIDDALKRITAAKLADDGTLTLTDNDGDSIEVTGEKIKWIEKINLEDSGALTVEYNTGASTTIGGNVISLVGAEITNDGSLKINYSNGSSTTNTDVKIKWPTSINNKSDGTVSVLWNDGTPQDLTNKIKLVDNITYDSTSGNLQVKYNTESQPTQITKMKWINNLSVNTDTNQKLHVDYNDGTSEDIGQPINYIEDMTIDSNNNRFLVYYSDPAKRGQITYNSKTGWINLGTFSTYTYNPGDFCSNINYGTVGNAYIGEDQVIINFTIPFSNLNPNITDVIITGQEIMVRLNNNYVYRTISIINGNIVSQITDYGIKVYYTAHDNIPSGLDTTIYEVVPIQILNFNIQFIATGPQ